MSGSPDWSRFVSESSLQIRWLVSLHPAGCLPVLAFSPYVGLLALHQLPLGRMNIQSLASEWAVTHRAAAWVLHIAWPAHPTACQSQLSVRTPWAHRRQTQAILPQHCELAHILRSERRFALSHSSCVCVFVSFLVCLHSIKDDLNMCNEPSSVIVLNLKRNNRNIFQDTLGWPGKMKNMYFSNVPVDWGQ